MKSMEIQTGNSQPDPISKVGSKARPRLGVGHLLLWIVCCCVYLAVVRELREQSPSALGVFLIIVATAIDGTALAGLLLFLYRRFVGSSLAPEPGEWLLAIMGARLTLHLLLQTWLEPVFSTPAAVLAGATCALLVLPTLDRQLSENWKILFVLLVVVYLLPMIDVGWSIFGIPPRGLSQIAQWLNLSRPGIVAGLVLAFSIEDQRRTRRIYRGIPTMPSWSWLHWLGVANCLATVASAFLLGRV